MAEEEREEFDRESIRAMSFVVENWFRLYVPFEYEYGYQCTEYESDCPDGQ